MLFRMIMLTITILFAVPAIATPSHIYLKPETVLDEATIRLGDVFAGLKEEKAKIVIGHAPLFGEALVLNHEHLINLAKRYQLHWYPLSQTQSVTLRRDSYILQQAEIIALITTALSPYLEQEQHELTFDKTPEALHLDPSITPEFRVDYVNIDSIRNRFSLTLMLNKRPLAQYSGSWRQMVEVAVLNKTLERGDMIRPHDITLKKMEYRTRLTNILHTPEELIGKVTTKTIKSGQMIRESDIMNPILVTKGSLTIIRYDKNGLVLALQAKALNDGAKDDVVQVMNTTTKRIFDAKIIGPNEAEIISW